MHRYLVLVLEGKYTILYALIKTKFSQERQKRKSLREFRDRPDRGKNCRQKQQLDRLAGESRQEIRARTLITLCR